MKKMTTTKKLITFLFANCTILELFTMYVTVVSLNITKAQGIPTDFTPLITLLGAVIGEVISFAVYAAKSAKENTYAGITYMMAENEIKNQNNEKE